MDLDGLRNNLEQLKLALGIRASLTKEPAPCQIICCSITLVLMAKLTREPAPWQSICCSITLVLKAMLTWEPAPRASRISLSAGDGSGKGRGEALEFVAGLTWAVAESLEFGGSNYMNVRNGIISERY